MKHAIIGILAVGVFSACSTETSFTETTSRKGKPNSGDATPGGENADGIPGENNGSPDGTGGNGTAAGNGDAGIGDGTDTANGGPGNENKKEDVAGFNTPPPTAEEILASCAKGQQLTVSRQLAFAARQDCSWGTKNAGVEVLSANGNLSILNGWIRAREEQTVAVQMPPNAILCGLDLKSNTPTIHFDDYFALRLENYVVAASKVLADALAKDNDGHYLWDWPKIRGDGDTATGTKMADLGKYCGTGDCTLPEHDKAGNFDVGFSLNDSPATAAANAKLFSKLSKLSEIKMTATSTGDNDAADCYHSGGDFTLAIKYVEKK